MPYASHERNTVTSRPCRRESGESREGAWRVLLTAVSYVCASEMVNGALSAHAGSQLLYKERSHCDF